MNSMSTQFKEVWLGFVLVYRIQNSLGIFFQLLHQCYCILSVNYQTLFPG